MSIKSESDDYGQAVYRIFSESYFNDYIDYLCLYRYDSSVASIIPVVVYGSDFLQLFEPVESTSAMHEAFKGGFTSDDFIFSKSIGVYAPVRTSKGNISGIIGLHINIGNFRHRMRNIAVHIMISVFVFMLIFSIVYISSSRDIIKHDFLTGLSNYNNIVAYGSKLAEKGSLGAYTAMMINIKNFKLINQKHGFNEGDRVLSSLSFMLHSIKRNQDDMLARISNDNFLFLVKDDDLDYYIKYINDHNPVDYDNSKYGMFPAHVVLGIYDIKATDSIERVISVCTVLMRNMKGSDITYYDDSAYSSILDNRSILSSYYTAVRNKEFVVFYQPKVDANTQHLCGAEALVRWYRNGKYISPGIFVPLFEEEGIIVDLDMFVLKEVCHSIKLWVNKGYDPGRISVNFSKKHFDNPSFADDVCRIIDIEGIDHSHIAIEITESFEGSNVESLAKFVKYMTAKNVMVSMDDFGTGYSSLSLLGDITIQEIKIDKSFIDRIFVNGELSSKFVSNVIGMIKDLGRSIVCEGVETAEQYHFVKDAGCDVIQGYFYDKPLSTRDFECRMQDSEYYLKNHG